MFAFVSIAKVQDNAIFASNEIIKIRPLSFMNLEQLQPNAAVRGIVPDGLVTVISVQWHGSEALELTYKTADGQVGQ